MTPENLTKALQLMECDEVELMVLLLRRNEEREARSKGFTLSNLIDIAKSANEVDPWPSGDEAFMSSLPVVIRLPNHSHPDQDTSVDCHVTACAVELVSEDNSGRAYRLVLDIENPLE